jgi:hypothetical protein
MDYPRQGRSQWLYEFLILAALILYPRQLMAPNTDSSAQNSTTLSAPNLFCAMVQGLQLDLEMGG